MNCKIIALDKIIIKEEFAKSKIRESKLNRIRTYYLERGYIDKPITINRKNVLWDGYSRYLVLKENNEKYATVKVVNWIPKKKKEG